MTAVLYTPHFIQFFDNNGDPLSGGLLYTYEAGTTTPKATFTSASGLTSNANPVVLDSSGRAVVFIDGAYKFRLETSLGVLVRETDNVTSFQISSAATGALNWATADTLASASTVNIGAASSNYVIITGTTSITAFDTIAQGAERIVRFTGALTLTHGSNLILFTSANIITEAGDIARFISEGAGIWRMIGYERLSGRPLVAGVTTFTSTNQTITAAGFLQIPHGFGAAPFMVYVELICQTSEHNYSVNDVLTMGFFDTSGSAGGLGVSIVPDATNLNIRYGSGSGGQVFLAIDKTTGATVSLTNGNWVARFKAVRF